MVSISDLLHILIHCIVYIIQQCVNSSLTGIFKKRFVVHGQYIKFATHFNSLHSIQEWRVVIM